MLDGIEAAVNAGLEPVKVNVVLMRGVNEDEVVDFATFGRERGVVVRFIEFMPLDADGAWSADRVVPQAEVVTAIDAVYPLEPVARGHEPAERFRYRDGLGEIGVIGSVSQPFCTSCDRVRLTADGQLRNCLFALQEHDLRAVLRSGGHRRRPRLRGRGGRRRQGPGPRHRPGALHPAVPLDEPDRRLNRPSSTFRLRPERGGSWSRG